MSNSPETEQALKEHFLALPQVVQDAILSTDVEARLRELSTTYKLHLDQWQVLEDAVMFTLLGITSADALLVTAEQKLGLSEADALALTTDISKAIFEPIREEMQRELGSPVAHEEKVSDIEHVRTEVLAEEKHETLLLSAHSEDKNSANPLPKNVILPATPPPAQPTIKSIRTEVTSETRTTSSAERKSVTNDLYREQV